MCLSEVCDAWSPADFKFLFWDHFLGGERQEMWKSEAWNVMQQMLQPAGDQTEDSVFRAFTYVP